MGDNLEQVRRFLDSNLVRTVVVPQPPGRSGGRIPRSICITTPPTPTMPSGRKIAASEPGRHRLAVAAADGPPAELIDAHQKNLRDCDPSLLCWARRAETWAMSRSNELKTGEASAAAGVLQQIGGGGPPPGTGKKEFVELFPRAAIDRVVDLTTVEPTL